MKIAILHAGDLEYLALGGVDQYIKSIIRNCGNNSIIVYGTCVKGQYPIGKETKVCKNGLNYAFFPISDDSVKPLTLGYLLNELKYINIIAESDIIYSQRVELTLPFIVSKEARNKLIQVVHGSSFYTTIRWGKIKSIMYNNMERESIKIALETYVVLKRTEYGVPYYKNKYPTYKEKIHYTAIPVNTAIFHSMNKINCCNTLGLPTDKFIILYAGRVENYPKRVFLFPKILRELNKRKKEYYFVVLGDGNDLNELKKMFSAINDEGSYRIVGYLESRDTYVKYINASNCSINISEFEGTCTASLESVACGTPVVSTDAGDIRMFVDSGKNGFVVSNTTNKDIVQQSVESIIRINDKDYIMTDSILQYESTRVVTSLIDHFSEVCSNH